MRTRSELTKALQETEGPLKVTSECLYKREGRKVFYIELFGIQLIVLMRLGRVIIFDHFLFRELIE